MVEIQEKIRAYFDSMTSEHHRYRSWEHCYQYFRTRTYEVIAVERHHAALQLAFYLASWGMYRGSSFLPRHAYTAHLGVVDQLLAPSLSILWEQEFGAGDNDDTLVPTILEATKRVRDGYRPFVRTDEARASDTLVTKVLLGTFGCLPACDRYFITGFKSAGFPYSYVNAEFIERVLWFCQSNLHVLRDEQTRIAGQSGVHYPLMKLVDMYFWQIGSEL